MSDDNYDYDEYEADEEAAPAPSGKGLRAQLERTLAEKRELEEQLSEFWSEKWYRTVEDTLSSKGLNPGLAQFVPDEVGVDPAQLDAWIQANGALFNTSPAASVAETVDDSVTPKGEASLPQEALSAFNTIQRVGQAGGANAPVDLAALQQAIKNASTPEELRALTSQYTFS